MVAVSDESKRREGRRLLLELHGQAQYALLVGSLLVLALTGLPQKFDSLGLSRGIETLRLIHHIAGGVLIFVGFYHFALVLIAVLVFKVMTPLQMIPDAKDLRDALQMVRYFLGLRRNRVAFDRPSYFQKIDYWVIVWSLAVMGVSGLVVLFPVRVTRLVSGEAVLAAARMHSDSAILVVAWVLIMRLIYVGLAPALFPYKATILSGRTPRTGRAVPLVPKLALGTRAAATVGNPHRGPSGGAEQLEVEVHPRQEASLPEESELEK